MSIEQFEVLTQDEKAALVNEATKVTEKLDGFTIRRLFKVGNYFVEIRKSLLAKRCKIYFTTYSRADLPILYVEDL